MSQMREYAKISPRFWIGHTGRQIKKMGMEAQLISLYLMTAPSSTMIGIYYLPIHLISYETGIPFEGASKGLRSLIEVGFCSYDSDLEYVWVHEMASYQFGGNLKDNDNRIKGVQNEFNNLPRLCFLRGFYEKYKDFYKLSDERFIKDLASPFEGASKTLRSKEKEIEQEKEIDIEKKYIVEPNAARPVDPPKQPSQEFLEVCSEPEKIKPSDPMLEIFEHWKIRMGHPQAVLDERRKKLIRGALKMGYTPDQLCEAITGCSKTPHNMGKNDNGQRYDGLHIIFKDADQIDRFIRNARSPPSPIVKASRLQQDNIQQLQSWVGN